MNISLPPMLHTMVQAATGPKQQPVHHGTMPSKPGSKTFPESYPRHWLQGPEADQHTVLVTQFNITPERRLTQFNITPDDCLLQAPIHHALSGWLRILELMEDKNFLDFRLGKPSRLTSLPSTLDSSTRLWNRNLQDGCRHLLPGFWPSPPLAQVTTPSSFCDCPENTTVFPEPLSITL